MPVETPAFAGMLERMIRAYGVRVGSGDPVDLGQMVEVKRALDRALVEAVRGQREAGFSWAEIGEGLGTSKQNAQARFGRAVQTDKDPLSVGVA